MVYHSMEFLVLKGSRQYAGGGANGLAGIFTSYVGVEMVVGEILNSVKWQHRAI
jgi:hypothetical protein